MVPMATALPHKEKPGFVYIPPGFMHMLSYIILIILFISHMGYKTHSVLPPAFSPIIPPGSLLGQASINGHSCKLTFQIDFSMNS